MLATSAEDRNRDIAGPMFQEIVAVQEKNEPRKDEEQHAKAWNSMEQNICSGAHWWLDSLWEEGMASALHRPGIMGHICMNGLNSAALWGEQPVFELFATLTNSEEASELHIESLRIRRVKPHAGPARFPRRTLVAIWKRTLFVWAVGWPGCDFTSPNPAAVGPSQRYTDGHAVGTCFKNEKEAARLHTVRTLWNHQQLEPNMYHAYACAKHMLLPLYTLTFRTSCIHIFAGIAHIYISY